jgi:hypothetical protein
MRFRFVAALAALVVASAATAGALPVPAPTDDDSAANAPPAPAGVDPSAAGTAGAAGDLAEYNQTMVLDLQRNGDARWTVTIEQSLPTRNATEAFRELGQRWENGIANVQFDADLFRQFAGLASDATGRQMEIPTDSIERSYSVDGDTGTLTLSFTWTNFAQVDGDQLVVDDSFLSPDGSWLPYLEPGQTLVIRPPDGYVVTDSPPGPGLDDEAIRWEGPESFSSSYFTDNPIVFRDEGSGTGTPGSPGPTSPGTSSETPGPTGEFPRGLLFGVIAALLLGGGMAVYRSTGGDLDLGGTTGASGSTGEDGPTGAEDGDAPGGEPADGGESEPADESPDSTPAGPFAGVDEELLSDEERVQRLLEANGGRMKQATIVKETDWSNAKVSQLLSSMADDEEIDKLRIGRENLISLPDVDVEE